MNAFGRRLSWAIVLAVIAALLVFFRYSVNLRRELTTELARAESAAAETKSALLLKQDQRNKLAQKVAAIEAKENEPLLNAQEQRQRDLLTKIEGIPLAQNREPSLPIPAGPRGNVIFYELIDTPGYGEKVRASFRGSIVSRYGPWLQSISSPELRAKAETLLVDAQFNESDAEEAAVRSGLDLEKDRTQVFRLRMQLEAASAAKLREALGEEEHSRYVAYGSTLRARESLAPVILRLSYSPEPLTPRQIERIVGLMSPQRSGPVVIGAGQPTNEEVLTPAKTVFSSAQWEAVQELVRESATPRR